MKNKSRLNRDSSRRTITTSTSRILLCAFTAATSSHHHGVVDSFSLSPPPTADLHSRRRRVRPVVVDKRWQFVQRKPPFIGCCQRTSAVVTTTLARRQRDDYYEEEEGKDPSYYETRPVRETYIDPDLKRMSRPFFEDDVDDDDYRLPVRRRKSAPPKFIVDEPTADWWDDDLEEEDGMEEENDIEEQEPSSGNFWFNPKQGLDGDRRDPSSGSRRRGSTRTGRNRDDLPPSTAPPHQRQSTFTTSTREGQQRRRPPLKTTFRSGTPPPPAPVMDLYNRLFWYGFDPADTTSPADPTMFGGTKGKFNGLAYLKDGVGVMPAEKLTRKTRNSNEDSCYWEDDADEDDFVMYDDEFEPEADTIGTPVQSSSTKQQPQAEPIVSRVPVTPPYDPPQPRRSAPTRIRVQPYPQSRKNNKGRPVPRGRLVDETPTSDWVSKKVSSWFRPGTEQNEAYSNSLADDDDIDGDDNYGDEYSKRDRSPRRKRQSQSSWSLLDAVGKFLGLDRMEMDSRAEEYDRQMGIGRRPSESRRSQRARSRRRKGYAYRYRDEDGTPPVVDFEVVEEDVRSKEATAASSEATEEAGESESEMPWEERALSVERVPPAGVPAWGPTGDLGMDARTKAILDAMEDIHLAKQRVDEKKTEAEKAKEDIAILRVDAELEKKRLRNSMQEARVSQAKLRRIDLEIQDASRALRYAQQRLQISQDELAALERRHWAVLSFYNPKQVEDAVKEAIREFEESEPAARMYREKTESMDNKPLDSGSASPDTANE